MTQRSATVLYVGAVALMAALLAALWLAPGPLAALRHWQAPSRRRPLDDVQAALLHANPTAGAAYPVVLARPLFEPTRSPSAKAPTATVPTPAPSAIEQAKLQGVVAGPTLSGVMLEEGGQSRFVRVGEAVGDWTLHSVQGRRARFVRRGQQRCARLGRAGGRAGRTGARHVGQTAARRRHPPPSVRRRLPRRHRARPRPRPAGQPPVVPAPQALAVLGSSSPPRCHRRRPTAVSRAAGASRWIRARMPDGQALMRPSSNLRVLKGPPSCLTRLSLLTRLHRSAGVEAHDASTTAEPEKATHREDGKKGARS